MNDHETHARTWNKIALAITVLVLARGILWLSVLPPLEGPDEYQHIAYLVYLKEKHVVPNYETARISESMNDVVKAFPHPVHSASQLAPRGWSARTYPEFWNDTPAQSPERLTSLHLYQSQHPPLFYVVSLPLWLLFASRDYLLAINAIRLLNVLLLAASVFVFLKILQSWVTKLRHRVFIGLLVGFYPMLLTMTARVSNDSLAIFLAMLALYFITKPATEKSTRNVVIASGLVALAMLTKSTALVMAPAIIVSIGLAFYRGKLTFVKAAKHVALVALVIGIILAPVYVYYYVATGDWFRTGRNVTFRLDDQSLWWIWSHARYIGWSTSLIDWVFAPHFWTSGWSFVLEPTWLWFPYMAMMYGFWIAFVVIGLFRGWRRRKPAAREHIFARNDPALIFGTIVLSNVLALGAYSTLSIANWGFNTVVPSYFMIALPVWMALLYQAAVFLGPRFAAWFACACLSFYAVMETMAAVYIMPNMSSAATGMEAWRRVAALHPVFPGPWFVIPCLILIGGSLVFIYRHTRRAAKGEVIV
ncbi:MAG: glycosyltransferase family 39 protein [Pyrinomonadaceae bacterium]